MTDCFDPVSYTHLDVYKRQGLRRVFNQSLKYAVSKAKDNLAALRVWPITFDEVLVTVGRVEATKPHKTATHIASVHHALVMVAQLVKRLSEFPVRGKIE